MISIMTLCLEAMQNMMSYKVLYFQPNEFLCPCCRKGVVASSLVYFLDQVRRAWGGAVNVNSAWRCPVHNAKVGGSPTSRHLIGCAADLSPIFMPEMLSEFKQMVHRMTAERPNWEVIQYPWGIHVAVPRSEVAHVWDGNVLSLVVK